MILLASLGVVGDLQAFAEALNVAQSVAREVFQVLAAAFLLVLKAAHADLVDAFISAVLVLV